MANCFILAPAKHIKNSTGIIQLQERHLKSMLVIWYLLSEFAYEVKGDKFKATPGKLYLLPKCKLKLKEVKPQYTERKKC